MTNNKENNWPIAILEYLYKKYSSRNVRLNHFLEYELHLDVNELQLSYLIDITLTELVDKKLIEYYAKPNSEFEKDKLNLSKLGTIESNIPGTIKNYFIDARLTFEGFNYISNLKREKRLADYSKVSAFSAIASAFLTITSIILTCNESKRNDSKIIVNIQYEKLKDSLITRVDSLEFINEDTLQK